MLPLLLASAVITNSTNVEAHASGGSDTYASVYVENVVNNGEGSTTIHIEHSGNGSTGAATISVPAQHDEAIDYATSTGGAQVEVHIEQHAAHSAHTDAAAPPTEVRSGAASSTAITTANAPETKAKAHWKVAIATWFRHIWSFFGW